MSSITNVLARRKKLVARAQKAQRDLEGYDAFTRTELLTGNSTGERQLDLAIVFYQSFDKESGKKLFDFEERIINHPGEAILFKAEWQEPMILHCIEVGGYHPPTHQVSLYILGVISEKPKLSWDNSGRFTLPIQRFLVLEQEFSKLDKEPNEVASAAVTPDEMSFRMRDWHEIVDRSVVGNEEVKSALVSVDRHALDLSDRAQIIVRLFKALGIETFDESGQGNLKIPDPAALKIGS